MKGKRYSEEQIARILKEHGIEPVPQRRKEVEGGKPVAEVCREHV